jgi:hypothetical protein
MYGEASRYLKRIEQIEKYSSISWSIFLVIFPLVVIYQNLEIITDPPLIILIKLFVLAIMYSPIIWFIYRERTKAEKEYYKFYRGGKAEGAIYYELAKLSNYFFVFQDIKIGDQGNIDFVVLGPTGLFSIEVKSHQGVIAFNGKELTLNNSPFQEKDILKQAMAEALSLHGHLKEKIGMEIFVNPALVFASSAIMHFGLKSVNNVFVIQKLFLRKLICSGKRIYTPDDISKVSLSLKELVQSE